MGVNLTNALCALTHRKYCLLTSNGTLALQIAFESLALKPGTSVAMPANLCLSPANAVLGAGLKPLLTDIDLDDGNISIRSLEMTLKRGRSAKIKIGAILAPHIYGSPCAIQKILALARRYKIPVIEDAAQALGASVGDQPVGSLGAFSVLSFGHTKITDVGMGGALLTNDKKLFDRARALLKKVPAQEPPDRAALAATYSKLYYSTFDQIIRDPRLRGVMGGFAKVFQPLYYYRAPDSTWAPKVLKLLTQLPSTVNTRRANAELYTRLLNHPHLKPVRIAPGAVPWRVSFLLTHGNQQEVAHTLRRLGHDVSSWYPPIHWLYPAESLVPLKNADTLGASVLNFWTHPDREERTIRATCDALLQTLGA